MALSPHRMRVREPAGARNACARIEKHHKCLHGSREIVQATRVSTGGALSFFVGWFSDGDAGERLAWPLLRELAELRISLELDVYGPDPKGGGAGGAPPVLRGA